MSQPLAIDLCCGLGGWTEGLLAEGYFVIGFDIERHEYGEHRYPGHLVVQDVTTLHGSQFKDVALIVASPPCQKYSYMAMPWTKAKAEAAAIRADETGQKLAELNRLFDACFRIQAQASLAAGRHIPMVLENVRGAIPWVGRSRWNFGSFHLWGDVPALMPITSAVKNPGHNWSKFAETGEKSKQWNEGSGRKVADDEHIKLGGSWFHGYRQGQGPRNHGSRSTARKAASAKIAKIPPALARHIAVTFKPCHSPN